MRSALAHLGRAWRHEHALGASPEVGRVFLCCRECRRVVPMWRLVGTRPASAKGCRCGFQEMRPTHVSEITAWAFLIYGFVWRRLIRRLKDWDPRMPLRLKAV